MSPTRMAIDAFHTRPRYIIIACLMLLLPNFPGAARDLEFAKESKRFDRYKEDPSTLIQRFYDESKILLLGAANHRNYRHHEYLTELLKKVGADPKLRFVVLEQFNDNSEFYRLLSTKPINQVLKEYKFDNDHERGITLCWSREWAYVYTHVFPVIQQINQQRTVPLTVLAVDGFSSSLPAGPPKRVSVEAKDCTFDDPSLQADMVFSRDREEATARNFNTNVWSKLGPGEKAIVLYHQEHLYRGFESCGVVTRDGQLVSEIGPMNWLTTFLLAHREAARRFKLIMFDERDVAHHSHGVLRFSKRQADRYPGQSWSLDMRRLYGLDLDRGENGWMFSQTFNGQDEGMHHSDKYFYQIVDAVVFSPRAQLENSLKARISDYLPEACPAENYDGYSLWHAR